MNNNYAKGAMHTMAITIQKSEDTSGNIVYVITRMNDGTTAKDLNPSISEEDNYLIGYRQEYDKDGLYRLINEYTEGENVEPLKVLGIKDKD